MLVSADCGIAFSQAQQPLFDSTEEDSGSHAAAGADVKAPAQAAADADGAAAASAEEKARLEADMRAHEEAEAAADEEDAYGAEPYDAGDDDDDGGRSGDDNTFGAAAATADGNDRRDDDDDNDGDDGDDGNYGATTSTGDDDDNGNGARRDDDDDDGGFGKVDEEAALHGHGADTDAGDQRNRVAGDARFGHDSRFEDKASTPARDGGRQEAWNEEDDAFAGGDDDDVDDNGGTDDNAGARFDDGTPGLNSAGRGKAGANHGGFNAGKLTDDEPSRVADDDVPSRSEVDDDNTSRRKPKPHNSGGFAAEVESDGLWGGAAQPLDNNGDGARAVPRAEEVESEEGGYSYTMLFFVALLVVLAIVFHKKIRASVAGSNTPGARRRRYDRRSGRGGL